MSKHTSAGPAVPVAEASPAVAVAVPPEAIGAPHGGIGPEPAPRIAWVAQRDFTHPFTSPTGGTVLERFRKGQLIDDPYRIEILRREGAPIVSASERAKIVACPYCGRDHLVPLD